MLNQVQGEPHDRWQLYWRWVITSYDEILKRLEGLEVLFRQTRLELNEAKQIVDLHTLKQHEIVGLTTNGAARLQASLGALGAPIGKLY